MPRKIARSRKLGGTLGEIAGGLGSMLMPIPGINGAALGRALGSMLPFRRGGVAKKRKAAAKKRGGK